jgi:hypothetical protein
MKTDPGKLIGSTFGRQAGLRFMYFGVDEEWKFHRCITASLKDVGYYYCGKSEQIPRGIVSCGSDPLKVEVDKPLDVVTVDANCDSFSTVLYMCLEEILADDGLLCVDGSGVYRFPLFRAMMKEGVISPFNQNEFEERGIVLFRKQVSKFSRIV